MPSPRTLQPTARAREAAAGSLVLAVTLLLSGCGTPPRDPALVWQPQASESLPSAAVVYRPGPWLKRYAMDETKPKARSLLVQREASAATPPPLAEDAPPATRWTITESRGTRPDALTLTRSNLLERRADGSVALVETTNHEDGSLTHFDPPAILWPGTITPGDDQANAITSEGKATVRDVQSPDTIKQRGSYRQELKIGVQAPDTHWPGGPAATSRLTMDISGATITRELWLGIDPQRGIIAERQKEVVEFGPLTIRRREATLRETTNSSNDQTSR